MRGDFRNGFVVIDPRFKLGGLIFFTTFELTVHASEFFRLPQQPRSRLRVFGPNFGDDIQRARKCVFRCRDIVLLVDIRFKNRFARSTNPFLLQQQIG